jgi:putative peptide zinc metalloprotease protein
VRAVALAHPGTPGEIRLVDSALSSVRHSEGPSVASGDLLARAQLIGYARLTDAFHGGAAVSAGRGLAVLATAVLVICLLALALSRRLPASAVALSMLAVLAMGPAVITLATVGPGLVGAAWAASGAVVLACARRRSAVVLAWVGIAVGIATEPLAAVPLAVGMAVYLGQCGVLARPWGRPHPAPVRNAPRFAASNSRWWLRSPVLLVVPVVAMIGVGTGGDVPLDASEVTVLLLLAVLLVVAGILVSRLRPVAGAAGSTVLMAGLPWPGAGSALPLVVVAVVLLGTCLTAALIGRPVEQRAHPLVRAALAVPALVLVIVGALFQPSSTGPAPAVVSAPDATTAPVVP